ncbi:hypothetical protein BSL78_09652 [Apostichopus japonicus]|uniref:Uncharacterized protein n=1 Tax=Stichopus japonicus TaxID=307972 RepID=A0A2G8KZM3_STIJA|nr:hypothetical protein BSL78_09652 [Apostichopus japonicus]
MELNPDLQEKKQFLIEGLKRTYKGQYDAIQPLPYIKDRLYCVDKVFVEGALKFVWPRVTPGTRGSWERLESYKSIYTDFRFKSKRRIIQGEPGYAHHLVTLLKNAHNLSDILRFLDPFDLQYLFRFACGLDPNAGKKLINHLKGLPGGDKFAISVSWNKLVTSTTLWIRWKSSARVKLG